MFFEQMTIAEITRYLDQKEELCQQEEELLSADKRRGVAVLLKQYHRRIERNLNEESRLHKMLKEEKSLWARGYKVIAGIDEAGRGPLAGPVVAAAVILDPAASLIRGLNDSKKLSKGARERIFEEIVFNARSYAIASASCREVDQYNIHAASLMAMKRALKKLTLKPEYVLVDGFKIKDCSFSQKAVTGGDAISLSIAAASVLAKVSRDKIMAEMHYKYPAYGFIHNKGYGTFDHREAIVKLGPCPEHRRSFRLTD